jgi:hypothetical protein
MIASQPTSKAVYGIMIGYTNRKTFVVNPFACDFSGISRMADMAPLFDPGGCAGAEADLDASRNVRSPAELTVVVRASPGYAPSDSRTVSSVPCRASCL